MPISLTCILCKTLQHIVASSITKHLSQLDIFYELQHGFRARRSCESQLIMRVDDIFKSVYTKKQTDLILLDFDKAFDKVSHEKLALKLYDCGIRGTALKWVKGFLDNRHQSVIVNGSSSEPVSSRETRSQTTCLWYIYIFIRTYTCLIWSTSGVCAGTTSPSNLHK